MRITTLKRAAGGYSFARAHVRCFEKKKKKENSRWQSTLQAHGNRDGNHVSVRCHVLMHLSCTVGQSSRYHRCALNTQRDTLRHDQAHRDRLAVLIFGFQFKLIVLHKLFPFSDQFWHVPRHIDVSPASPVPPFFCQIYETMSTDLCPRRLSWDQLVHEVPRRRLVATIPGLRSSGNPSIPHRVCWSSTTSPEVAIVTLTRTKLERFVRHLRSREHFSQHSPCLKSHIR